MRVAMIGNYPVQRDIVPGGVTAVAATLARGLARLLEIEIHVVCLSRTSSAITSKNATA